MKKILFLIAAGVCAAQISNAQIQKGQQTLGGSLGLNHNLISNGAVNSSTNILESQSTRSTNFSIGPAYSYFIADKVELGGLLSYSTGTYSTTYFNGSVITTSKQNSNYLGGALYLRKYCLYDNKIGIRTGPYISYFKGDNKYTLLSLNSTSNSKSNTYNVGASVDLVYYPSNSLGFAATLANLAYSNSKATSPDSPQSVSKVENLGLNFISNDLSISVFYVFGSK
jgi:hypothetical protein